MHDKKDMDCVVVNLLRDYLMHQDNTRFYDIQILFKAKVLENYKYLLTNDFKNAEYYEITYNGWTKQFYIHEYVKVYGTVIEWSELDEAIK